MKLYYRLNERMNSRFKENLAMLTFFIVMALYHFLSIYFGW
jgi:hypothetical protein